MRGFMNKNVSVLIATFLISETSPLADTSSYVYWKSIQLSPLPSAWPVWSSGARLTDWHTEPFVEVTTQLVQEREHYTSILN